MRPHRLQSIDQLARGTACRTRKTETRQAACLALDDNGCQHATHLAQGARRAADAAGLQHVAKQIEQWDQEGARPVVQERLGIATAFA